MSVRPGLNQTVLDRLWVAAQVGLKAHVAARSESHFDLHEMNAMAAIVVVTVVSFVAVAGQKVSVGGKRRESSCAQCPISTGLSKKLLQRPFSGGSPFGRCAFVELEFSLHAVASNAGMMIFGMAMIVIVVLITVGIAARLHTCLKCFDCIVRCSNQSHAYKGFLCPCFGTLDR